MTCPLYCRLWVARRDPRVVRVSSVMTFAVLSLAPLLVSFPCQAAAEPILSEGASFKLAVGSTIIAVLAVAAAFYTALSAQARLRESSVFVASRLKAEREAAEEALRLQIALEAMPNGLIMFDADHKVSVYNRQFLELWDLTDEIVAAYPRLPDLVRFLALRGDYGPGDPDELVARRLRSATWDGLTMLVNQRPNGRVLEIHCFGRPGVGYVYTYLDITARRQAEQALGEKAAQLDAVIKTMPTGIIVLNEALEIELHNQRFLEMWDFTDADLAANPSLPELLLFVARRGEYGTDAPPEAKAQRRLAELICDGDLRTETRRPNGRHIDIRGLGRRSFGHILTYQDVTEQRVAEQTIRENEQRLRAILNDSPVGIAIVRIADDTLIYWNPALVRMAFGTETVDMSLQTRWGPDFVHASDRQRVQAAIDESRPLRGIEAEVWRSDGSVWWCLLDMVPIDHRGEPSVIIWIYDITDRKRSEREQHRDRLFLRTIIDAIPANINVKDRSLRFVLMNAHQAQLCGVRPEDVTGRPAADLDPYRRSDGWEERDISVLETGRLVPFYESRFQHEAGVDRLWLATKLPLRDHEGDIAYVLTVGLDITDRRRAELALRQSEERLKLALAVTGAGVWDIDLVNRQRWWSPEIEAMTGYKASELARMVIGSSIHPEDRRLVRRAIRSHLAGQEPEYRAEYRVKTKNGRDIWISDVGRVVRDGAGQPVRFIGIAVDVTLRRATEGELLQAERMAALGRLVAGVAHEINTPIGLGVGLASHIGDGAAVLRQRYKRNDLAQEDLETYLDDVGESTQALVATLQRCAELVRSFKQVAVDQSNIVRRTFNLKDYLDGILISFGPKLRRMSHQISVICPEDLVIASFPGVFSQIVTNLVENSVVHAFDGKSNGCMVIEISATENWIRLTYRDNGRGMTDKEVSRIFEPFYTTKRGQGGSGLGMHVVFNLVTQTLRGQIACRSRPGAGLEVEMRIPLEPTEAGLVNSV